MLSYLYSCKRGGFGHWEGDGHGAQDGQVLGMGPRYADPVRWRDFIMVVGAAPARGSCW